MAIRCDLVLRLIHHLRIRTETAISGFGCDHDGPSAGIANARTGRGGREWQNRSERRKTLSFWRLFVDGADQKQLARALLSLNRAASYND